MATIGIDLRPLQGLHRYRGIGVYISKLMRAISEIDHHNTFVLYMFPPSQQVLEQLSLNPNFRYEVREVTTRIKNETVYKFLASWRTYASLDPKGLDVFLQPDIAFGVATNKTPTVSVFYDTILTLYREHHLDRSLLVVARQDGLKAAIAYMMNRRVYLKNLQRYQLCSRILSISKSTKKDLLNTIDYPEDKVATTQLAASEEYRHYPVAQINETLEALRVNRPYVLYIGGADYRKNVIDALDAFAAARTKQPALTLVLVGRDFEKAAPGMTKELQHKIAGLGSSVLCVGYGRDEDLPKLYAGAEAFLFPSMYEGFGFPALEAMKSNCPVVAYANSSLPEIVQGSFDLADTKEQYQAILLKVLFDKTYKQKIIPQAQAVAATFSWEKTASLTIDNLQQVANEDTR